MPRKPNYDFQKRQKEAARRQRKAEKRERKKAGTETGSGPPIEGFTADGLPLPPDEANKDDAPDDASDDASNEAPAAPAANASSRGTATPPKP